MKNACYGRIIETERIHVKIQNSMQKKKMLTTLGKRLTRNWLPDIFLNWFSVGALLLIEKLMNFSKVIYNGFFLSAEDKMTDFTDFKVFQPS